MKFRREQLLLYAVTDRAWTGGAGTASSVTLAEQVRAALRGGATMVQLREKELLEESFEWEAREILEICRAFGAPMLINDNVQLAKRVGADGVHVGQGDMDPRRAREILGPDAIVGVTAKTVEQARAAEAAGADYLGSGAVFGTGTKKDAVPLDLDHFEKICGSVSIPVAAIGGITEDNIERLSGRGMSGFAVVSGIFSAGDPGAVEAVTRRLKEKANRLCGKQGIPDMNPPGGRDLSLYAAELLSRIRGRRPVVQCITNLVTAGDCANALLAVGASPTMAHHPGEMEEFAALTDALVLNMGATESLDAMFRAGRCGNRPVVIDPVGCAGSGFRREKCLELIRGVRPACIRGNAAEIRALAVDHNTGRGVDDPGSARPETPETAGAAECALLLSKKTGAIVIATGPADCVAFDGHVTEIRGGSPLFAGITGSGCMLSALLGAFLAVDCSAKSAAACCELMARCGEAAEKWAARDCADLVFPSGRRPDAPGYGSFHRRLFDALSLM